MTSEMIMTTTTTTGKRMNRRILFVKRKGRKYSGNSSSTSGTTPCFGFLRRRTRKTVHLFCKAVVLLIILEGLGCGSGAQMIAPVEGATGSNTWQSPYKQQQHQQSTFGGDEGDNGGGGGTDGDSFISTFAANGGTRADAARRMRDRCGRYSLLKVLQQWENLQRKCRLSVRKMYGNMNSNASVASYPYEDDSRDIDRYQYEGSFKPSDNFDEGRINKRSRNPYYSAISKLRVNNNEDDDEYRNYYYEVNGDALESCCPVVFEVIAPIYGRNRSGHMVELYKDENVQQKFNEYRCHKDYLEKPCRFVDNQYRRISKCVQQYLDTYALVRSDTSLTGWSMEHIRVASGCACKVDPSSRRRKKILSAQTFLQQQRNRRRSRQYQDPENYNSGNAPPANSKNTKNKSFQQLLRSPLFDEY